MKTFLSLLLCSSLFAGTTPTDCNCDKGQAPQGQDKGQAPQNQGVVPPGDKTQQPPTQAQPAKTGQDAQGNPCTCDTAPKAK